MFCEVKTRRAARGQHVVEPLASVNRRKRLRLRRMARAWLAERVDARPYPAQIRFDAIGITFDGSGALVALEHVENAF
ncbi:MAG: YraN family protein [Thermoleophilaceae bacterium]|nr:YraN family protein [Thermoleophilaceae bacterium]